jgi:hypothetical protein
MYLSNIKRMLSYPKNPLFSAIFFTIDFDTFFLKTFSYFSKAKTKHYLYGLKLQQKRRSQQTFTI